MAYLTTTKTVITAISNKANKTTVTVTGAALDALDLSSAKILSVIDLF